MNYSDQLELEYQHVQMYNDKLAKATEQNNMPAIQVFEALIRSSWKAMGDLERLVKIFESPRRRA